MGGPADDPNRRLQEELARKTEEVRVLREVSSRVNTTLDLARICDIVLDTMHDLFGFTHAMILLKDAERGLLRVAGSRGYPEPGLGATVPLGVGVVGLVGERKRMMRVGNLSQQRAYAQAIRRRIEEAGRTAEVREAPPLPGLPNAESQVAIPLLIEDRLVGVFFVESVEQRVFGEHDETLIAIVANLCASAIHNALQFQAERRRSESLEGTVEERTRQLRQTSRELSQYREVRAKEAGQYDFDDIVGDSAVMRATRELLRKVARSPASTILITGENGTGKDLAAKVVHFQSRRASSPFMNITCSALPETLLESELFGHERGAFTDAHRQKKGLLELADGGSVFLDEIGEMSLGLQAKLLRFLEEKKFKRIGGAADIQVDVRVIAATHRDLQKMVAAGTFREDLYYRLRVLPLEMPALRQRAGDIEILVRLFLRQFQTEFDKDVTGVAPEVFPALEGYTWPGNVRELRNAVERAVLLAEGSVLRPADFGALTASAQAPGPQLPPSGLKFDELERSLVLQALERADWNTARAARLLGMPRDWLRYRIEKFDLEPGPNEPSRDYSRRSRE